MRAQTLKDAPIVHPTGMRHFPIECRFPHRVFKPVERDNAAPTAKQIRQSIEANSQMGPAFTQAFRNLVAGHPLPQYNIEQCLQQAWVQANRQHHRTQAGRHPPPTDSSPEPTLKSFWHSKIQLRSSQAASAKYNAPVMWYISHASAQTISRCMPHALQRARSLFACWRNAVLFQKQDRHFRKQARAKKEQQVDFLIRSAEQAEHRGISQLQQLTKVLRPKSSKRTIHFRSEEGHLLDAQGELRSLTAFFTDLYQSATMRGRTHTLQQHMCITEYELQSALNHMSSRKALPPKQVPAILWKLAGDAVVPLLCQAYNQVLAPGILNFPQRWNSAFMTLIPKPGKAPDRPAHLRPICLLPAESKLLARIAAERLKPLLQQALRGIPQFAYSRSRPRRAADAIDRVCAHCSRVRSKLKNHSRTVFDLQQKHATVPLAGGMILLLDMSRAYDKLPRATLEQALVRVNAPSDLIALILHIHDKAKIIFERHGREDWVSLGRGIRQGCGLSPLLWLAFTLLLHDQFRICR